MTEVVLYKYNLGNQDLVKLYHTSIGVYGKEISYSERGIESRELVKAPTDCEEVHLGYTDKSLPEIMYYVYSEGVKKYTAHTYHLIERNCNYFADFVAKFLLGQGIPKDLVEQGPRTAVAAFSILGAGAASSSFLSSSISRKNN